MVEAPGVEPFKAKSTRRAMGLQLSGIKVKKRLFKIFELSLYHSIRSANSPQIHHPFHNSFTASWRLSLTQPSCLPVLDMLRQETAICLGGHDIPPFTGSVFRPGGHLWHSQSLFMSLIATSCRLAGASPGLPELVAEKRRGAAKST